LLACLLAASAVQAQPSPEPQGDRVIIPITISPAPMQKLQSRFLLTPQYSEMQPGNRVPGFMKAYMEQHNFFSKEPSEQRQKWLEMPLDKLPVDEIKKNSGVMGGLAYRDSRPFDLFSSSGRPLSDVDEAARLRQVDWQEWFNIRRDGIALLLPEIQKMRELASVLKLRMRMEVKTQDFPRAIYSARTFFGLASALDHHPTLICSLVSLAIHQINLGVLTEFVQQPGAPNLYWGFAEMTAALPDLRLAIQGERILVSHQFEPLLKATGPVSDEDLEKVIKVISAIFSLEGGEKVPLNSARAKYKLFAADEKVVEEARQLLVELGAKPEEVKRYTALQAVITADIRQFEIHRDEIFKSVALPYGQAVVEMKKAEDKLAAAKGSLVLAPVLVPVSAKVKQAQVRVLQQVALLQVIEAIRFHAAEKKALPEKLGDIALPLPLDPVTGKDFEYTLKDGVGTLHGMSVMPQAPMMNRYYEIRLRK
jgi:hypothetical protein